MHYSPLESQGLPRFKQIHADLIFPAVKAILEENRAVIARLVLIENPSWENLIEPLAQLENRLNLAWSPVRHMNAVKSSPQLRAAYSQCLPLLSDYESALGQNRALYEQLCKVLQSPDCVKLDKTRQVALEYARKQFHLGGVDLEPVARARYQQLEKELAEHQSRFENNLLDASQSWQKQIQDQKELKGLPESALSMLKHRAAQKKQTGYRVTLDMPSYIAVITYADNRALRRQIYQAYTTRASDQGDSGEQWDNASEMVSIVAKKQEKATLLGFNHFAEYALETRMADSASAVIDFLEDLAKRARPAAIQEVEACQTFAQSLGFEGELEAWDYAYYSEKLKQHRYQISAEDLKPYFSADSVLSGLFEIVNKLYAVRIEPSEKNPDVWAEDVRFYQINDENNVPIGQFYLDLYARENKRDGAWMDVCINHCRLGERHQRPVAYLTCNLTPPLDDQPALFTHDEVITLFHEFGHGLHHLLTEIDIPALSGINGVEWDAVELPSQFMENYCWQKQALALFARHYQTGEALPDRLFEQMIAAKNFHSALQLLRQIEFALFDIKLYQQTSGHSAEQIQQILDQVRSQVAVIPVPESNRFQNGFTHIFAGGYAAGYYSYLWAEVLSADAFAAFEEAGVFSREMGQKFFDCILKKGGSRSAMESFQCFRGRSPEIEALLRHRGIGL